MENGNKKRILFISDGVWTPSGFGTVMKNLIYRLKDDYDIALQSWQFIGNKLDYDGFTIYPVNKHAFGADVFEYVYKDFKPDVVITLGDCWMFTWLFKGEIYKNIKKWIWYLPIDSEIIPTQFIELLDKPTHLITMAGFAHDLLNEMKIKNVHITHGVDTKVYKPLDTKLLNEKFRFLSVNRNQDRKQLTRLIEAFSIFAKGKDDVELMMHCDPSDPAGVVTDNSGFAYPILRNAIQQFGVKDKVKFTGVTSFINGCNVNKMAEMYNNADVQVSATTGEGFGLTIAEGLACGLPQIMTNCTSAPELIGKDGERGFLVNVKTKMFGSYGSFRALVDVEDFANKMELIYNSRYLIQSMRQNCLEFIKDYDWDKTIPKWKEVIED